MIKTRTRVRSEESEEHRELRIPNDQTGVCMGAEHERPSRREMRTVCGEIGSEDGVDPRELAKARLRSQVRRTPSGAPKAVDPKALRLGKQAAETLAAVLAGDSGDEILRALRVVSVTPAPDASRLLVTLRPLPPADQLAPVVILDRLTHASGWLRTELAGAITRKRAPTLTFQLIWNEPVD